MEEKAQLFYFTCISHLGKRLKRLNEIAKRQYMILQDSSGIKKIEKRFDLKKLDD